MHWMKWLMAGVIREDEASRRTDYLILAAFVALSIAAVVQLLDIEFLLTGVGSRVQALISASR